MSNPGAEFLLDRLDGIEGFDNFDVVDSLNTPEQIAFYLNDVLTSRDFDLMKKALQNVLKSKKRVHPNS